jgi:hypothetical protein
MHAPGCPCGHAHEEEVTLPRFYPGQYVALRSTTSLREKFDNATSVYRSRFPDDGEEEEGILARAGRILTVAEHDAADDSVRIVDKTDDYNVWITRDCLVTRPFTADEMASGRINTRTNKDDKINYEPNGPHALVCVFVCALPLQRVSHL